MMNILIVDDHPQNRYLLQFALEAQGWKVTVATQGQEALDLARAAPPDLIITDILMPVMDGFSLCREWRKDERLRKIPFIFYTATYTDEKDEEFALSLGADRFLVKPQDPERWPAIIRETLEQTKEATPPPPAVEPEDPALLQVYNQVLVHKLEQKVAELEAAEARSRAIADNTPTGIYVAGADGHIHYTNTALQNILKSSSSILGTDWMAYISEKDRRRVIDEWNHFIASGAAEFVIEYSLRAVDGEERDVYEQARPILAGERTLGYVGSVLDITERRRAEEQRAQLEAQLRHSQKLEAVGTLAGGVAHDFNNIISAILGNAEIARFDLPLDHPVQQSIEEIRKASLRAQNLVRQILAFSRKQPVEKKVLSLGSVVEEAVNLVRAGVPRDVAIELTMSPRTPSILADATQIHQIVANLCTNSWQALEGKPGRIRVEVERAEIDGEGCAEAVSLVPGVYACIRISDSGKGMPPEVLERIFEPFYTTKPVGEGTGLGLSVVHGIVQGHLGAITVRSQPNQGTTFSIYFPEATRTGETQPPFPD